MVHSNRNLHKNCTKKIKKSKERYQRAAKTSQKSALLELDSSGKIGNVSCIGVGVLCTVLARFSGGGSKLSPEWGAVFFTNGHMREKASA